MLFLCRADVEDVGPIVEQHWVNASYLLCQVFSQVSLCRGGAAPPPPPPLSHLSLCCSHLCYLTNIAIRPWLRYLSPKI